MREKVLSINGKEIVKRYTHGYDERIPAEGGKGQ